MKGFIAQVALSSLIQSLMSCRGPTTHDVENSPFYNIKYKILHTDIPTINRFHAFHASGTLPVHWIGFLVGDVGKYEE